MAKKDMKSALASSLKAEDAAVRDRFEKADSLLGDRTPEVPTTDPTVAAAPEKAKQEEPQPRVALKRDSFTIPQPDYEIIDAIRKRCLSNAQNVNKSEVLRAGLHALQKMSDAELLEIVESLEKVKTGRPASKP